MVDVLPPESDSSIQMMQMSERPDIKYSDIGGMDMQKQEVREAIDRAAELAARIATLTTGPLE